MPYGVSWGEYFRFFTAACLAMAAGSQTVHLLYRPLDGMEKMIEDNEKKLVEHQIKLVQKSSELQKQTLQESSRSS